MVIDRVIEQQARMLAEDNRRTNPDIIKVYWFPHETEVRLIELTEMVPASGDHVIPFYFRESPVDNLPAPSGVALVRPAEFGRLTLPEGWGTWEDAREV